jgi:hypothetical protein
LQTLVVTEAVDTARLLAPAFFKQFDHRPWRFFSSFSFLFWQATVGLSLVQLWWPQRRSYWNEWCPKTKILTEIMQVDIISSRQ